MILSSIVIFIQCPFVVVIYVGLVTPGFSSRGVMTRGPNINFEERDRSQVRPRDVMSGLTVPNMTYDYLVISQMGSYSSNFTRQIVSWRGGDDLLSTMVTRSPHLAGRRHRNRRRVLSDGIVSISDRRVQAVSRFDVAVRGKMKIINIWQKKE